MTHLEWICSDPSFVILAKYGNCIWFTVNGETIAEINGASFDCFSLTEFFELMEEYGDMIDDVAPSDLSFY